MGREMLIGPNLFSLTLEDSTLCMLFHFFIFLIFLFSKEYELMFKIIDRDGDGFLSVTELQKCCRALRRSEEGQASTNFTSSSFLFFSFFHRNKKNLESEYFLLIFSNFLLCSDMHDIVQNLDQDGDGKISLKEWLALVSDDN